MSRRRRALGTGLLLGVIADALLPDPRRGHPVALFGAAAGRAERVLYADGRWRGTVFAAACVGGVVALAAALPARAALVAAATWTVLGGRSLRVEAAAVAELLDAGDLAAARRQITHLVGRDPAFLDNDGIARAAVESVAENTSDAVVAPLFWGAVAGMPGLLGYRAANTLDAMVGHRSARYERFGWAAARLDDALNYVPARLTAGLTALLAPAVGGNPRTAARIMARYGRRHPSPNSGRCEAAFAGALGVRLGGHNVYEGRAEERPVLGEGRSPRVADIGRAARLSAAVGTAAGFVSVVAARATARRAAGRLLG
jgi:adenosylcobinamide-phosphate synthase